MTNEITAAGDNRNWIFSSSDIFMVTGFLFNKREHENERIFCFDMITNRLYQIGQNNVDYVYINI